MPVTSPEVTSPTTSPTTGASPTAWVTLAATSPTTGALLTTSVTSPEATPPTTLVALPTALVTSPCTSEPPAEATSSELSNTWVAVLVTEPTVEDRSVLSPPMFRVLPDRISLPERMSCTLTTLCESTSLCSMSTLVSPLGAGAGAGSWASTSPPGPKSSEGVFCSMLSSSCSCGCAGCISLIATCWLLAANFSTLLESERSYALTTSTGA